MAVRVLVVGSSNTDFIMRVPHLPAVGETVTDGTFVQTFGGKGANQAVAAARAGGQVSFVTGVGEDPLTRQMLDSFTLDGIDLQHILQVPDRSTGTALVMFDERGRNYLTVAPGANYALGPEYVQRIDALVASSLQVPGMAQIAYMANMPHCCVRAPRYSTSRRGERLRWPTCSGFTA